MSALEASSVPNTPAAGSPIEYIRKAIVEDLGIDPAVVTDADCLAVARVSEIVGTRGCRLSACALAAVVRQTGGDKSDEMVRFGLDGSLVEFYPRFESRIRDALKEMLGEEVEKRIEIGLAKDGSGVGGESLSSGACGGGADEMVYLRSCVVRAGFQEAGGGEQVERLGPISTSESTV